MQTIVRHLPDTACAPALAVLRLLDPVAADPSGHPDELFALAIAAIDKTIDAETADEAASTHYALTGDFTAFDQLDAFGGWAS